MKVVTLEVPELGNRCHLVHDGGSALVVDPPRDLAPVERAAEAEGVEIVAVADTHVHNDYVSGALGLARRHGADYLLSADERVDFERVGVRDGDVVEVGDLRVRVIATPGHTRHHQSFLATEGEAPGALFSGGSLLHGTVGRTDLVDPRLTHDLARAQWTSARTLAGLDPATLLHPTHGFGSFCAGRTPCRIGGDPTIGEQRAVEPRTAAGPRGVRGRAGGRARPGPLLLPAHGAAEPRRRRPGPAPHGARRHGRRRHRRDPARQLGGRPAEPDVVRRRARVRHRQRGVRQPSSRRTSGGWCRGRTTSCC